MQVKAGQRTIELSGERGETPKISLAIQPKSSAGYVWAGVAIGAVAGFALGAVVTLLVGEKSLTLIQDLWNRMTRTEHDGERVHFELLLQ